MRVWQEHGLEPLERQPDFERFRRAMTTREPGPVPLADLAADPGAIAKMLGEPVIMPDPPESPEEVTDELFAAAVRYFEQVMEFSIAAGWDFVPAPIMLLFPGIQMETQNAAGDGEGVEGREFWNDGRGPVTSWDEFERYPWLESPGILNVSIRIPAGIVPEGMKVMAVIAGLFDCIRMVMGFVPFSMALHREPDLVDAILERISDIIYRAAEQAVEIENVGGLFITDDLGFYSGTFVSPAVLREKFHPHMQRLVDLAHGADQLAVLHACGNVNAIMDDVCDMGMDAKHSFEDKIMPLEETYARWGDRMGIIGGVDMHLLTSGSPADVRKRTREILDACGPTGHYALGTGNSVASHLPMANYLAMIDEGRQWNRDHFGRDI